MLSRRELIEIGAAGIAAVNAEDVAGRRGAPDQAPVSTGWQNVKAFGARGDGVADDSGAIQTAINAAASTGGGLVFLPPGKYRLLKGLQLGAHGVGIVGSGNQASRLFCDAAMPAVIQVGSPAVPVYRWWLADFGITDPRSVAESGILLNYGREGRASDLWLYRGFTRAAIELRGEGAKGNWTNRLERVIIALGAGDGVILGPQSNAVFFTGCHFTSCAGQHVRVLGAEGVKFVTCQFEQAASGTEIGFGGGSGGRVQAVGIGVVHCYFELKIGLSTGRALRIDDSAGPVNVRWLVFDGNMVYGQGAADYLLEIDSDGPVSCAISRNGLFGGRRACVRVRGGADVQVAVDGFDGTKAFAGGDVLPLLERVGR